MIGRASCGSLNLPRRMFGFAAAAQAPAGVDLIAGISTPGVPILDLGLDIAG